jgi:hypothetical protein
MQNLSQEENILQRKTQHSKILAKYFAKIFVKFCCSIASVADPGCLSRILIFTHPGSRIPDLGSRIPDPKTVTKVRGEKKFVIILFL